MKYLEVDVHTTTEAGDIVAEFAREEGALGAYIIDKDDLNKRGDAAMWDTIDDAALAAMPEDTLVRAVFTPERAGGVEKLQERLDALKLDSFGLDVGKLTLNVRGEVDDSVWLNAWKEYFKPFRVGRNLIVKPPWESYAPDTCDMVMELDPGMAFGTGTHETTALCLELLEDIVQEGDTALDVGTGSGILAIAAVMLGADRVLAVDMDADAVTVAKANIERNGLSGNIRACTANLLNGLDLQPDTCSYVIGRTDLVIANILADVVIELMPQAKAALRAGGRMIASGIIQDRADDVRAAFERSGFKLEKENRAGEWVAIAARKA